MPQPATILNAPILGGPESAWVTARGAPRQGPLAAQVFGDVEVIFSAGASRARQITFLLRPSVPFALAREQTRSLHPPDARLVRTYKDMAGLPVELYHSELLAQAFGDEDVWSVSLVQQYGGASAGDYIQLVEQGHPTTTSTVIIATGNNP
jgi:hypothetical protein